MDIRAAGPARTLATTCLLTSFGFGLYTSVSALYFHRQLDLSMVHIGEAVGAAGLLGLLLAVPIGRLADRRGPRGVTMILVLAQAVLMAALPLVRSFPASLAVVVALGVALAGAGASYSALLAGVVGHQDRVRLSAYLRSVANVGMTVGIGLGGLTLAVDTPAGYLFALWANAACRVVVVVLLRSMPAVPAVPGGRGAGRQPRLRAVRDLPYLAVAQVNGLLELDTVVLTLGLPLWLTTHTSVPRPLAAWLIGLNTVLVVLLQVRASRGADTVRGAGRLQKLAFAALAGACALIGLAADVPALGASVILLAAVLLITVAELWGAAAGWAFRFELAPDHAQGQYGAAFTLGTALPTAVGPLLITVLMTGFGGLGWFLLAGLLIAGMSISDPVVRWAIRTRELLFVRG